MSSLADILAGQANPSYDAQQVAGGGVLGQALLQQRQQLDDPTAPQQNAQGTPSAQPMMTIPPGPHIRPGFATYLEPKDWTPEEHAAFRAAHGIPATGGPPSSWAGMIGHLMKLLGVNSANAQQ